MDMLFPEGIVRKLFVCTIVLAMTLSAAGASLSKKQILEGADARIEKHRMGDMSLKLIGSDGKVIREGSAIKVAQQEHAFLFGCNIFKLNRCRTPEDNKEYARQFSELKNFATLPFYWWNYERQKGVLADDKSDEIIKWCKANNITTKGHPLAWNYVDPRWLKNEQNPMGLQMDRIERCVRRFEGGIEIWDVVNEATHYDRAEIKKRAPVLVGAIDEMGVGEYVRQAFRRARAANPKATLLINDYRVDQVYIDKVINELVDEKGKAMYDVIGIQSHQHGGYWGAKKTWEVCERYVKFDVPLHFTETTFVSGPKTKNGWKTTPEGEITQCRDAVEFYTILFSHPSVEAITWWDFTDQGAWQGAPAGFVRDDMTPKPMYHALKKLIKGKWWTKLDTKVGDNGKVDMRGFYGDYEVSVKVDGKELAGEFVLDKNRPGTIEVRLK